MDIFVVTLAAALTVGAGPEKEAPLTAVPETPSVLVEDCGAAVEVTEDGVVRKPCRGIWVARFIPIVCAEGWVQVVSRDGECHRCKRVPPGRSGNGGGGA